MRLVISLLAAFALASCGGSSDPENGYDSIEEYDASQANGFGDSDTFHGYECTDDCGGHEAGYAWAEDKGIDDPDNCGGKSQSFIEGCRAYAEENGAY